MSLAIRIRNATVNNLRGVSADIPHSALTCLVGRSGSGKSSFGIDVLLRGCSRTGSQGVEERNAVLGPLPAVAVRQRLRFDLTLNSVTRALGLSQSIQRHHPESVRCTQCAGNGALARLLPDQVIADGSRTLMSTALHPLVRPVLAVARDRLPCPITEKAFGELPEDLRSRFLFGPAFPQGWQGLQAELLQASESDQLEISGDELRRAFYEFVSCPQCTGVGLGGLSRDLQAYVPEFAAELPLGSVVERHLRLPILCLTAPVASLSAGERQWLRILAAVRDASPGMLVLLDEPTAGMCVEDATRVSGLCQELVHHGCTVVVIEHSPTIIASADHVIEFGPGGGKEGGRITFAGSREQFLTHNSPICDELRSLARLPARGLTDQVTIRASLGVGGTHRYGLDDIVISLPERKWTCISGAIGTGKSGCMDALFRAMDKRSGAWLGRVGLGAVKGRDKIRRPHLVDQNPIGLNPHSIPLTYIDAMTGLRRLFAELAADKGEPFGLADFSFNTRAGRCEVCAGYGCLEERLAGDVYWRQCHACEGSRYRQEISRVTFRGLSIGQVLKLTVSEAARLFEDQPLIARKLGFLERVGLGYLAIGQPSNTLSGGETQRVKIARHLAKKLGDRGLYLLDTPSRGLSLVDARYMADVFRRFAGRNTVVVADNHPHFVDACDWLVVLGRSGSKACQLYAGPPAGAPPKLLAAIRGAVGSKGAVPR